MTELLLIRHGQSLANLSKYFAGALDVPLTELGHRQAQATADYICSTYRVDAVYASDLSRAFDTGKAVADRLGLFLHADASLREIFAGQWEGVRFDKLMEDYPETYAVWRTDIGNAHPDGGESVAQLQQRIVNALRRICAGNDGKTLVIATHATPIRVLQCHCEGKSLCEMGSIPWVSNASVTHARYENGVFSLLEIGHDGHLGSLVSVLPANV